MCICKSATSKCAVSVAVAFPVMLLVAAASRHLLGHGTTVPMPGGEVDVGLVAGWVLCVGAGDVIRRGVRHLL